MGYLNINSSLLDMYEGGRGGGREIILYIKPDKFA
jgi:hypothetical protein